ncbi:MAG TPA: hypothetical protein VMT03_22725 [Polyangia bacterium]|nr:hypothetical protein [Polyangia bacterium]
MSHHSSLRSDGARINRNERPDHAGTTARIDRNTHTELNREAIRRAFAGWQQGTANIADMFALEMVWRIERRSVASKEYRTKKEFVDEVLAPFAGSSDPFRPVRIRAICARERLPSSVAQAYPHHATISLRMKPENGPPRHDQNVHPRRRKRKLFGRCA